MYKNNTMGYRDVKDRVDYHDALYKRIGEINSKYQDGHDNNGYISELESIIQSALDSLPSVWNQLVKLYLDKKDNNKA